MILRHTQFPHRCMVWGGLLLSFSLVLPVHAADVAGTGSTITDFNWLVTVLTTIQTVITALGFIALQAAEYFLRPEFLNGTLTSDGRIHDIWILARDIVNIIFAVMLIGVAMYTIIMGSSAKVKEYIVYFVMGVVLVNVSWFFPRVIIDISHILTATVYQLPSALPDVDVTKCLNGEDCTMITSVIVWPTDEESVKCENLQDDHKKNGNPQSCDCIPVSKSENFICYNFQPFNAKTAAGAHAMLNGLAVNYGRLSSIGKVQRTTSENPPAGAPVGPQLDLKFFINILFSLVFSIALIFPIIALAAGLAIRILDLVFCVALMPFTFLGFVVNRGKLGTNIFGIEFDVWNEFIVAAFVPFFVACTLSLGFVFLNANVITPLPTPDGQAAVKINYFVNGISNWQSLLAAVFTIVIIWTGVFASFAKSKTMSPITNKIKSYGQMLGSMALKTPLLIPVPLPGGGSKPLGFMLHAPENINAMMEQSFRTGQSLKEIMQKGGGTSETELQHASNAVKNDDGGVRRSLEEALEKLKKSGTSKERTEAIQDMKDVLKRAGIKNADSLGEEDLKRLVDDISRRSGTPLNTTGWKPHEGTASVNVVREGDDIVVNADGERKQPITKDMQEQLLQDGAHTVLESVGIGGNAEAAQKVYEEMASHAQKSGDAAVATKAEKIAGALRGLKSDSTPEDVKKAIQDSLAS